VKIELSQLQSEITQTTSGHQTALYVASFRIVTLTNKCILFRAELLFKPLLLILLICIESLADVD
jgi:hypothetical protein